MLIPAQNINKGLGIAQSDNDRPRGFFGRLWHNIIKPRIGAIVGLLIGGPIGAILGELIQQGVTVTFSRGGALHPNSTNIDPDQYPISEEETNHLLQFIENQLKPTIAALANTVDAVININIQSRTRTTVTNQVLIKANKVLQAIATIRAHNNVILQYGERKSTLTADKYSTNYVRNKVEAIELTLNALEQATIQYITNNVSNYRLVETSFTASRTTRVERMQLSWQGKTATAIKKMYVDAIIPPNPNETPVEVVQTTTTTAGTPDVIITSPSGNSTEIKESKPSLLKIGAIAAIAIVGYQALSSK